MKSPVLLLDDDRRWSQICLEMLPQTTYILEHTPSLPDALERLATRRYPVVVCDLRLVGFGDRGGFELLTRAKSISEYTKVIIITAYGGAATDTAREAWKRGAFNYLMKPFDFADLDECITAAIGSWRQEVEAMANMCLLPEGPELGLLRGVERSTSASVVGPVPEEGAEEVVGPSVDLVRLRRMLVEYFGENDLRDLCFDLRVRISELKDLSYDSLPGEGNAAKARELIVHLERRGLISELVRIVRELRPKAPWDEA